MRLLKCFNQWMLASLRQPNAARLLPFNVFVIADFHLVINGAVMITLRRITLTPIYKSLRQIPKGGALITLAISDVNLLHELSIQVWVFKPISLLSCYDLLINYRYLVRKGEVNY